MRSAPLLPLLLLLSSALLLPAAGRLRLLPGFRSTQRTEQVVVRAAGDASLAGEPMLRLLQRRTPHLLQLLENQEEEQEEEALLKRSEEPPLSIDLTFHLLRNMIQMAQTENQRAQAQINRKVLDEVGK